MLKVQNVVRNAVVIISSLAAAQVLAANPEQPRFWDQVRGLVQRCAVRAPRGPLESSCAEIQVNGSQASFQLNGQWYQARIVDSEESDGGDLNDVFVVDQNGADVAERRNTPAFGDILLGLAGGEVQLQEQDVRNPALAQ